MGGNAFPELHTPRLSHSQYDLMRTKCITVLQQFYEKVVCAPEGPEKIDHGDVDLLVCLPKSQINHAEALSSALEAVARTKIGKTTSFAIPLDNKEAIYVQVDVHVCPPGFLEWELWMNSYGDLIQILGVLNRSIGLTMNDKGLNVRVPEVESSNRKASMILLSFDPSEVMKFLGLDVERYNQGFSTMDEAYEWCSAGRFYGKPRAREEDNDETANDRVRYKKRPMFGKFFSEWNPANPGAWKNEERLPRQEVLDEAISYFKVKDEYDRIISTWRNQVRETQILDEIKAVIPAENMRLQRIMRGLKRWTTFIDDKPQLKPEDEAENIEKIPAWLTSLEGQRKQDYLEWVKANYAEINRREKARSEARQQVTSISASIGQVNLD